MVQLANRVFTLVCHGVELVTSVALVTGVGTTNGTLTAEIDSTCAINA